MMKILNKYFDKVYVITMENSFRIPRMEERLEGVDYEFFYGVDGATLDKTPYMSKGSKQTRGQLGCTISHLNLYKKIVSENNEKVLILEDDCLFNGRLTNLGEYMSQLPIDWGLFYLGWDNKQHIKPNYGDNLYEITKNNILSIEGTQSFAIKPFFAKLLLEQNSNFKYTADGNITAIVRDSDSKTYVATPKMGQQDGLGSITCDIDRKYGF